MQYIRELGWNSSDIDGKWVSAISSEYEVSITKEGKNYIFEGTNGVYLHRGPMSQVREDKFEAQLKDVEGWCCGNQGQLELVREDKYLKNKI